VDASIIAGDIGLVRTKNTFATSGGRARPKNPSAASIRLPSSPDRLSLALIHIKAVPCGTVETSDASAHPRVAAMTAISREIRVCIDVKPRAFCARSTLLGLDDVSERADAGERAVRDDYAGDLEAGVPAVEIDADTMGKALAIAWKRRGNCIAEGAGRPQDRPTPACLAGAPQPEGIDDERL
jgi:hypothetical protein